MSHETALESSDAEDSDLSPCDTYCCLGSRYNHNYIEAENDNSRSNFSDKFLATDRYSCH